MREMEELKKRDPERYELTLSDHKLERRMDELAESYRKADSAGAREEIRKELKGVIADRLDVKIKLKAHEVELIREELKQQEKILNSWKEGRESFVEQKLGELTGAHEREMPF
jgi:hypothetical protein